MIPDHSHFVIPGLLVHVPELQKDGRSAASCSNNNSNVVPLATDILTPPSSHYKKRQEQHNTTPPHHPDHSHFATVPELQNGPKTISGFFLLLRLYHDRISKGGA